MHIVQAILPIDLPAPAPVCVRARAGRRQTETHAGAEIPEKSPSWMETS